MPSYSALMLAVHHQQPFSQDSSFNTFEEMNVTTSRQTIEEVVDFNIDSKGQRRQLQYSKLTASIKYLPMNKSFFLHLKIKEFLIKWWSARELLNYIVFMSFFFQ